MLRESTNDSHQPPDDEVSERPRYREALFIAEKKCGCCGQYYHSTTLVPGASIQCVSGGEQQTELLDHMLNPDACINIINLCNKTNTVTTLSTISDWRQLTKKVWAACMAGRQNDLAFLIKNFRSQYLIRPECTYPFYTHQSSAVSAQIQNMLHTSAYVCELMIGKSIFKPMQNQVRQVAQAAESLSSNFVSYYADMQNNEYLFSQQLKSQFVVFKKNGYFLWDNQYIFEDSAQQMQYQ